MPQQVGEDYPEAYLVMLIPMLATNEIHSSILGYVHHKVSDYRELGALDHLQDWTRQFGWLG